MPRSPSSSSASSTRRSSSSRIGRPVEGLTAELVEREIGRAVPDWPGFVKAAFEGLPVDGRVAAPLTGVWWLRPLRLADRSPGFGGGGDRRVRPVRALPCALELLP